MLDQLETPSPLPNNPPAPPKRPRLKSARQWWRDIIEIVMIVVTIYTFVNLLTARAIIEGVSMQPNFYTNQLVIVDRVSYYFRSPARGDVVVISNPTDACKNVVRTIDLPFFGSKGDDETCADFIKRVIGLPGETVQLKQENSGGEKAWRVYVNGVRLDEPYIAKFCDNCTDKSWVVGADQFFLLGDNRSASYDSHLFGPVDRTIIVGQAWVRYWPPDTAGFIPHPAYGPVPTSGPQPLPTTKPGN
ncbi:MAG TPA: signal peptidase I [Aggregatilineales bacterium]|nr:signal peptidase I [Aggregatilineales bacterium]